MTALFHELFFMRSFGTVGSLEKKNFFKNLPRVLRHRYYELTSPAALFKLQNLCPQILTESYFIPLKVDKLIINGTIETYIFIDKNGYLCQKINFQEFIKLNVCYVTREVFIDQLSTQQLAAVIPRIEGPYSSLSLTGFPNFEDFKRLIKPTVKNVVFCGKFLDLPKLQMMFDVFAGVSTLTLVQYCESTNITLAETLINNYISKNSLTLKYFRLTLTLSSSDSTFQHIYAVFDKNIIKISVFGDNVE